MNDYAPYLARLASEAEDMVPTIGRWANVNSYSFHLEGLNEQARLICEYFADFPAPEIRQLAPTEIFTVNEIPQSRTLGPALQFRMRPQSSRQALLMIHYDTVYPPDITGAQVRQQGTRLYGPGVADAKAGIVMIRKILSVFEQSPWRENVGWTVFLNPDEEIGSPGSRELLSGMCEKVQLGLVFEPCLPNGNLIHIRKGSGNFTLIVRGQEAHAGRAIHLGRNAIEIATECIHRIKKLHQARSNLTVNIGIITGGCAVNVVPGLTIVRFNVRIEKPEDEAFVWVELKRILEDINQRDEKVRVALQGGFFAPPKVFDQAHREVFTEIQRCAASVGISLEFESSGGVCDGNRLSAMGVPTIDTLGPCGGGLHSPEEYLGIPSLVERSQMTLLLLLRWAAGEWHPPTRGV